jgi:hypothetical protein
MDHYFISDEKFINNLPNPSVLGIEIKIFLGNREWTVREADKFTAICQPLSKQCGILNVSQHYRPARFARG